MKINKLMLFAAVFVVAAGAGAGIFLYKKMQPKANYLVNCDKAKRIYNQLASFQMDYETLPSQEAVEMDETLEGIKLDSANGYLRQLAFATNMVSEEPFYIEGSSVCKGHAADNKVTPQEEILKAGENGWAYFSRKTLKEVRLPLLVPGWNPETKEWDEAIWEQGIPVLMTDGSVSLYKAGSNGKDGNYATLKAELPFSKGDSLLLQPLK